MTGRGDPTATAKEAKVRKGDTERKGKKLSLDSEGLATTSGGEVAGGRIDVGGCTTNAKSLEDAGCGQRRVGDGGRRMRSQQGIILYC
ncbi:hypothetical protein BHE74_00036701 [Ensete ventricosum]|nr:hypothetical protein BHE74_00036701 [Ensete ventricosum]